MIQITGKFDNWVSFQHFGTFILGTTYRRFVPPNNQPAEEVLRPKAVSLVGKIGRNKSVQEVWPGPKAFAEIESEQVLGSTLVTRLTPILYHRADTDYCFDGVPVARAMLNTSQLKFVKFPKSDKMVWLATIGYYPRPSKTYLAQSSRGGLSYSRFSVPTPTLVFAPFSTHHEVYLGLSAVRKFDDTLYVATGNKLRAFRAGNKNPWLILTEAKHTSISDFDFSPDGKLLATVVTHWNKANRSRLHTVRLFEVQNHRAKFLHEYLVDALRVSFASDGLTLATLGSSQSTTNMLGPTNLITIIDM